MRQFKKLNFEFVVKVYLKKDNFNGVCGTYLLIKPYLDSAEALAGTGPSQNFAYS